MERITAYRDGNAVCGPCGCHECYSVMGHCGKCSVGEEMITCLAAYEDTSLTPEEVAALQGVAADLSHELGCKNVECAKLEDENADKERYTTELYSRARDAEREREELQAKLEEARADALFIMQNYVFKGTDPTTESVKQCLRRIAGDTQEG